MEVLFQTAARCLLTVNSETAQRANPAKILALDLMNRQIALMRAVVKRRKSVQVLGWVVLNLRAVSHASGGMAERVEMQ